MIVDGSTLYVLGFNFVQRDIERSRSLGLVTRRRDLVQEAIRLFEADFDRKPYTAGANDLRREPGQRPRAAGALSCEGRASSCSSTTSGSTDNAMIRILRGPAGSRGRRAHHRQGRRKATAALRENCPGKRQHLRAIVRDGRFAFLGSQSLRKLELDSRREIGVLIKSRKVVSRIVEIFEADWARTPMGIKQAKRERKSAVSTRRAGAAHGPGAGRPLLHRGGGGGRGARPRRGAGADGPGGGGRATKPTPCTASSSAAAIASCGSRPSWWRCST